MRVEQLDGNREMHIGDDSSYVLYKTPPFKDWVLRKISMSEYNKLTMRNLWELFMQWKHGFSSEKTNEDIEIGDNWLLDIFARMTAAHWANMKPTRREYLQHTIEWIRHCKKVWMDIKSEKEYVGQRSYD